MINGAITIRDAVIELYKIHKALEAETEEKDNSYSMLAIQAAMLSLQFLSQSEGKGVDTVIEAVW